MSKSRYVLEVAQPGILTTIQDGGRGGYRPPGVSRAGGVDWYALQAANLLVGNHSNAAGLELTWRGPELIFYRSTILALTGADLEPYLNGMLMPMWASVAVQAGDMLCFGRRHSGCRAYLAVAGGLETAPVLGSRSTDLKGGFGGWQGRQLAAGDMLRSGKPRNVAPRYLKPEIIPRSATPLTARVILGPQDDLFSLAAQQVFLTSIYTVTNAADRTGYRLMGPALTAPRYEIISDPTPPGSIQVLPSGQPVVLLAEGQTTGGYAKIAVVITADLGLVAQLIPGEQLLFTQVTVEEGQQIYREKIRALRHGIMETRLYQLNSGKTAYQVRLDKPPGGDL